MHSRICSCRAGYTLGFAPLSSYDLLNYYTIRQHKFKQGNQEIRLRPRCAIPPSSRPIIDSSNDCNQASAHIVCTPLPGPVQFAIHSGVRLVGHMFPQNFPLPFGGSSPSLNTLFLGPSSLIIPNGISIGSAVSFGISSPW